MMKEIGPILRPVRVRVCYDALTDSGAVDAFARQGYSYKTVIREKHIEIWYIYAPVLTHETWK